MPSRSSIYNELIYTAMKDQEGSSSLIILVGKFEICSLLMDGFMNIL